MLFQCIKKKNKLMNKEENKEFVLYEQALDLRELGFDEPCICYYNTKVNESICFVDLFGFHVHMKPEDYHFNSLDNKPSAPSYRQAFKWFREKHNLHYEITYCGFYRIFIQKGGINAKRYYPTNYTTYSEAELDCLKELIKIVKNAKQINGQRE